MGNASGILSVWKKVFTKRKYLAILILVAFAFYLLNGFILELPNIRTLYSDAGFLHASKALLVSSIYFKNNILSQSLVGIVFLSILIGAFISLLTYRFDVLSSPHAGAGIFGTIGIFLGAAAQGCTGCGVGVLSVLGFSSLLTVLPFHGKELLPLAILVTGYSVYSISVKLNNPVCPVKITTQLKGGKKK